MSQITIACVQENVVFGQPASNGELAVRHLRSLADQGVDLAVFPEAFLTGYVVATHEAAAAISIPFHHPVFASLQSAVNETGITTVIGFAEQSDGLLYNTAALLRPHAAPTTYRKTHLPFLGLDRFTTPGDCLPVFDLPWGRLGIQICFDLRFPEAMRVMTLAGADVVVLPTNWPTGALIASCPTAITRASENRIFLATCNRVGEENGATFIGRSRIIDPEGAVLAEGGSEAQVIVATINPESSRQKNRVVIPGEYETNMIEGRRPDLYGDLVRPVS